MIPERLVVLTFDDGERSQFTYVAPLLKRYGFGATFFITEGLGFEDKKFFVTWDEVRALYDAGFEIGNHTGTHRDVRKLSTGDFRADLQQIERRCREHGIPRTTTFCYPGYHLSRETVAVLSDLGYQFARRGVFPECLHIKTGESGPAYDPHVHHPLLIPAAGISGVQWTFEEFVETVGLARNGRIAVLCFHGVPGKHPKAGTPPDRFETFMRYLSEAECRVIALRDLATYLDPNVGPAEPFESIEQRVGMKLNSF